MARFQELHDLLVRSGIIWQTYQLWRLQLLIRHVRRKYNSRRLLGKGHEGRQVHNAMPRISWGTVFLFLSATTKRLRARGHEIRREQGKDAHLGFRCGGPSSPIGSSRWNEIRSALYRTSMYLFFEKTYHMLLMTDGLPRPRPWEGQVP